MSPGEALLGRASGRAWKVFTFVEGLILVKDDRASAPENHVCVSFFFWQQTLELSRGQMQCRAEPHSASGRVSLWVGSHCGRGLMG